MLERKEQFKGITQKILFFFRNIKKEFLKASMDVTGSNYVDLMFYVIPNPCNCCCNHKVNTLWTLFTTCSHRTSCKHSALCVFTHLYILYLFIISITLQRIGSLLSLVPHEVSSSWRSTSRFPINHYINKTDCQTIEGQILERCWVSERLSISKCVKRVLLILLLVFLQ